MRASKFWQVRCFIRGKSHRLSTKTTSIKVAEQVARRLYERLLVQCTPDMADETYVEHTWDAVSARLLQAEWSRVVRNEFAKGSWQVLRNRLNRVLNPFFKGQTIGSISSSALLVLSEKLSTEFSSTTVHQYLVIVRKAFGLAKKLGFVKEIPEIPTVKAHGNSRGAFTPSEYWTLIRKARALVGHKHPDDEQTLRKTMRLRIHDCVFPADLPWAISLLVHAFMRPSDLKNLRHKHVEIVNKGGHTYLRLSLPESKKHNSPIVTLPTAVRIYREIVKHYQPMGLAGPNDFLIMPQQLDREHMLKVLSVHFNWVLKDTGLKMSPTQTERSLYSLRHSAITFRLLYGQGVDLLTLALNARTSVDMIERHYASTLQAEQNIAMLHSRRT
jgi:integrase